MFAYVNDILVTRRAVPTIQSLILHLNKEFALKNLGIVDYFIRIQVEHFSTNGLHLSQTMFLICFARPGCNFPKELIIL